MTAYILLAMVVIMAAALGGYFLFCRSAAMRRKLKALELLSQFTPGQAACRWLTPGFRGVLDGRPFAVELPRDSSATGFGLQISMRAAPAFQLEMHRGVDVTDIAGAHGQMDFDIISDPDFRAPLYLNDPARRQYIWNFLSTGFSSFMIEKHKVRILMHNCDLDEDLNPATVHIQLLALVQLAKDAT